ncbi:MAG: prepilin-type N-terminal cleavage/methylation domain-containing protein [Mariniblastus sp.]|nr:prepilin-type N-terminal cleavage/methylation domain-containing protein [Mariniblastus sp.]
MARGMTTRRGITLVEMLIAMAITLVMIGAVVTIFANVTGSVQKRRAMIEMSGQLRHARNVLQRDLAGATCPAVTWQRPESNHGYLEIIEGPLTDANPTGLIFDEQSASVSLLPRNNLVKPGFDLEQHMKDPDSLVPGGLGDADDILMLTVRNEQEPFVGRVPDPTNPQASLTIESPLAEVVWFAVENPLNTGAAAGFFGEPGLRTIYRRALLIAPWAPPYEGSPPGVMQLLPAVVNRSQVPTALAALIAFQEQYDLSVRLEWDPQLARWKIVANTLADLTRRENRYEHHHYRADQQDRTFPFAVISAGMGDLNFEPSAPGSGHSARPFCYRQGGEPATARAILNDNGEVVHVVRGLAPLWGKRRGEDVMLTDALAFDLRLFDPGAPLFVERSTETVLAPSDFGWKQAYRAPFESFPDKEDYRLVGQGAYVDAGYGLQFDDSDLLRPEVVPPWFFAASGVPLAPGYSLYDTWSFHYENNGLNEDGDDLVDEGTNGFDDDLAYGVDDVGERETMPPYDVSLRAMQVKLRIFELDTQQIREVTVGQHFVAE